MNREELAKELGVTPWSIDDWLLKGCPAIKIRTQWEFDLDQVKSWLKNEKIKIKKVKQPPLPLPFNERWLGKRCPLCIDRGFPGEKAGLLYNFGEVLSGRWQLRRTGIPCGHSQIIDPSRLTKEKETGFLF